MGLLDMLHLGKKYTIYFAYRREEKPLRPGVLLGRRLAEPTREELLGLAREHLDEIMTQADDFLNRQFTVRLFVEAKRRSTRAPGRSKTRLRRVTGASFTIVQLHEHIFDVKAIG